MCRRRLIVNACIADNLIREGRVDLTAVGRELLKDPDWAKKANETLEKS
jgi:2,4-dienoyl-CoA reductase-like NADH-dependent reductase (Old Yellow Enzyme family)